MCRVRNTAFLSAIEPLFLALSAHPVYTVVIAVLPECQRMGYGKRMIEFIEQTYRDNFRILRVGTGDSQLTLPFYKKCGFIESHRIKNFFTDNYDHPIFECGVQLIDMVYLEKNLLLKSNTIHRKKQMEYLAFCK